MYTPETHTVLGRHHPGRHPLATYTPPPADSPSQAHSPPAPGQTPPLDTTHTPWTHPPSGQTPPVEMTIEAGGTHLAGMHSCYRKVYSCLEKLSRSFEMSKNITVIDWKFNWPNNLKSIYNKNAFQQDAYRPLIDRMLKCASRGVYLVPGGSAWSQGDLPGPRGVCLCLVRGDLPGRGGLPSLGGGLPGPGGSAWSGGSRGGVCLVRWGLPGPGGRSTWSRGVYPSMH